MQFKGTYGYDFEVYVNTSPVWWCVTFINKDDRNEIHTIIQDTDKLREFYESHKDVIYVGYNSRHFDAPLYKAILAGQDVKKVTEELINFGKKPYQVLTREAKNIMINNYDCILKDKSLKQLEAFMGSSIIECKTPFDKSEPLTDDEIAEIISYNIHDVNQCLDVLEYNHDDFESQTNIMDMYNLDQVMFNKTKVQLAAHVIGAVQQHTLDDEFDFTFPETVHLKKYKHVQDWFANPKNWRYKEHLYSNEKQHPNQYECEIAGVPHTIAYGGVHGARKNYHGKGIILAVDVSSQYPSIDIIYDLLSRKVKNPKDFEAIRDFRLELKAKKDARNNALKPMINGVYGGSKDRNNPLYDPRQANLTCIYGQLVIIYLIELVEPYCTLIQSNTDGMYVMCDNVEMLEKVKSIAAQWEKDTMLELEYDEYCEIWQKDVNNYAMFDKNGHGKYKGAFVKKGSPLDMDFQIVNEALRKYFKDGTPVEETINNCNDMIMYQRVIKLTSAYKDVFYGDVINDSTGTRMSDDAVKLKEKVHRVFASKRDSDKGIYKMKVEKGVPTYEKIANLSPKSFIYNESLEVDWYYDKPSKSYRYKSCKQVPDYLDKEYYISMAKDRIKLFLEVEEEKVNNTPNILFDCFKKSPSFYDFLANCKEQSIQNKELESYIIANCCVSYGKTAKLMYFKSIFDLLYKKNTFRPSAFDKKIDVEEIKNEIFKYAKLSATGKTYVEFDYESALKSIWDIIPNKDMHSYPIICEQLKKFNEARYIDESASENTWFILNTRNVIAPNLVLYNLKNGNIEYMKVDKNTFNIMPLQDGDIIEISVIEPAFGVKIVGKDDKGINILEEDTSKVFKMIKAYEILFRDYSKKGVGYIDDYDSDYGE